MGWYGTQKALKQMCSENMYRYIYQNWLGHFVTTAKTVKATIGAMAAIGLINHAPSTHGGIL